MDYYLEENGSGSILYSQDGPESRPLISFKTIGSRFTAKYNNINIDNTGLCRCRKDFGETFTMSIQCKSTSELNGCRSSFIRLATNGFASPLSQYYGMDWEDLQRACHEHPDGYYYSAILKDSDALYVEQTVSLLIKKIKDECGDIYSAIICNEEPDVKDLSLETLDIAISLFENGFNLHSPVDQQMIVDGSEKRMLHVWVFPQNESDK